MWEKKNRNGGIHDQDTYVRGGTCSGYSLPDSIPPISQGIRTGRSPNVNELQSLVDYGGSHPAVDAAFAASRTIRCTIATCSCTTANEYSSLTSILDADARAWGVAFDQGGTEFGIKNSNADTLRAVGCT